MKRQKDLKSMRPLELILKECWYLFTASWVKFLLFSLVSAGLVLLTVVFYLIPAIVFSGPTRLDELRLN